jgi:hypothetical protein
LGTETDGLAAVVHTQDCERERLVQVALVGRQQRQRAHDTVDVHSRIVETACPRSLRHPLQVGPIAIPGERAQPLRSQLLGRKYRRRQGADGASAFIA